MAINAVAYASTSAQSNSAITVAANKLLSNANPVFGLIV